MKKTGILVASFGTTHKETAEKTIALIEKETAAQNPDCAVVGGYTSRIVHRKLRERGEPVRSVEEALEYLLAQGVSDVIVQPTHLLPGEEYEKLLSIVQGYGAQFRSVTVGKPLMATEDDAALVGEIAAKTYPPDEGGALVLMGHGTEHDADGLYHAMNRFLQDTGYRNVFVGTVEGETTIEDVSQQVTKGGYRSVRLAPLMLVAGEHAVNDMAGQQEDSWKSILERSGCRVEVSLQGLGELPQIRALYGKRLSAAREALG